MDILEILLLLNIFGPIEQIPRIVGRASKSETQSLEV